MNEIFDSILKCSPMVLLALAINLVLLGLKRAPIPAWLRPLIAMVIGGVANPFIADTARLDYNLANPNIYWIVQGVCIGGLAVALNQTLRKWLESHGIKMENGDTDEIRKNGMN
jgi:hypothetical protein